MGARETSSATDRQSARTAGRDWQLSGCRSKIDGRGLRQQDAHWIEIDGELSIAAVFYDPKYHARDFYHAKLIASAPTMRQALETTRLNIVSLANAGLPGPLTEWLRVVDAALSRATAPGDGG